MIDWNIILNTFFSSSIVLGAVAWVVKSLFEQLLSRDLEVFKSSLQQSATEYQIKVDKEKEEFKASLQQESIEHQTRFQSLHTKRSEVIAELYVLIVQAKEDADSLVSVFQFENEPPLTEKAKKAVESSNQLHFYFKRNRIFLKPDICERVSKFSLGLRKNINKFAIGLSNPNLTEWQAILKSMDEELPQLQNDIEQYFRETFEK